MAGATLFGMPNYADWPSKRARYLFRVRRETAKPSDQPLTASQTHGVVTQQRYETLSGNRVTKATTGLDNFQHVSKGDFVISLRSFEGGLEYAFDSGCISPAYTVLQPTDEVDAGFFRHALKSSAFLGALQPAVSGIRDGKSVRYEDFAELLLPVPDLSTQQRIADFLDRETARIDELISKKEYSMQLMLQKKQAELFNGFQGLDAQTWRLRHLGSLKNGSAFPIQYQGNKQGEIAFFKVKHLAQAPFPSPLSEADDYISRAIARELGATVFPPQTIVFAKIGAALLLSRFTSLGTESCIDNNMSAFIPKVERLIPAYAQLALSTISMVKYANPGAVPSLNTEVFLDHKIKVPPIARQQAFVAAWITRVERYSALNEKLKKSISLLREVRSALITAAVTGQIDVDTWRRRGEMDRRMDEIEHEAAGAQLRS